MFFAATLLAATTVFPSGANVKDDHACYTISYTKPGEPSREIGITSQTIQHALVDGRAVIKVSVHQKMNDDSFDLTDNFTLSATDLQPITYTNEHRGKPFVTLKYIDGYVHGQRMGAGGKWEPIDLKIDTPIWEGNLFGVMFGALPLAKGASFTVPFYQYDKGSGEFTIRVTGTEAVMTPDGPVDAWVVNAGQDDTDRAEYLIQRDSGRELGYRAAGFVQQLGGECPANPTK